jgi:hypothetical protein
MRDGDIDCAESGVHRRSTVKRRQHLLRITAFDEGDWRIIPFESFKNDFLGICEAHRAQGRALAFAFILFDRSHPYVRSALAQQNYWDALNQRAGRYLSVFSLDARPPATTEPEAELRLMYVVDAPRHDHIHLALSQHFDGLDEAKLPCVLFFQVADAQVIDMTLVTLAGTNLSETYNELEAVIGTAADSVARVEDDNAQNAQEIFNLITGALRDRQTRRGLLRLYHVVRPFADLAGVVQLIRFLLGG